MLDNLQNKTIAALDLGSNSFHLLIANVDSGRIKVIHREKHLMRLRNSEKNYNITEEKICEVISLIAYLKNICEKYSAEIYAVATSAIRDALNKLEFIERITNETGINVDILSGEHEAELEFLSLKYSFHVLPESYLLFDLGGYSTEFIFVKDEKIVRTFSLPIGAVRFANKYCDADGNIILAKECSDELKAKLSEIKEFLAKTKVVECFGMGGTVSTIANMIEYNFRKQHVKFEELKGCAFSKKEIDELELLVYGSLSLEEKKKLNGIESTRADIIASGITIIKTFFVELELNQITFSGSGLREGIIIRAVKEMLC